jgi:uncharacterized protein YcnI
MAAWRAGVGFTVTAGALVVMTAPVSAHVSIDPDEAVAGESARVVFRVPNESDSAATTELEVHFPEDTPIPSVRTGVMPGWSVEVERTTLDQPIEGNHGEQISEVVSVVTWTADDDGAAIQPGQYGEFPIQIGPLPDVEELFFRTLQTYDDGEIARWIELPANGTEPEFPAPSLRLTGAAPETAEPTQAAAAEDDSSGDSGGAPVWLAVAGLLAGLAGLALGGVAFSRTSRSAG